MLSFLRTLAVVTAVLLTLTHVAYGQKLGECVKDVQLTEQCVCGSHTCNPSVNEGGTHTGTGPDTQCKSATNTCAAPCSQTDGQTQFNTGNWHDDCTCGTATCAGMPNGSDKYCLASTSTCGGSKVYPACTKDTTLSDKCKCGPGTQHVGNIVPIIHVGIDRMVLPHEDALSSSKMISQRTSIFKKMMKKIHGTFLFSSGFFFFLFVDLLDLDLIFLKIILRSFAK